MIKSKMKIVEDHDLLEEEFLWRMDINLLQSISELQGFYHCLILEEVVEKGRVKEADISLEWLHRKPKNEQKKESTNKSLESNNAPSELVDKAKGLETHVNIKNSSCENTSLTWKRKDVMIPFGLVVAILIFQQVSGIDSIVFYTVSIFKASGSPLGEYQATILVGVVQLLATIVSLFLIDYFGRKPLLLTSGLLMCVSMIGLGAYFFLYERGRGDNLGLLPLISQFVFTAGYSIGYCNVPFILMGELLPLSHRSVLSSVAGACNLGSMFIVIKTFPDVSLLLGSEGAFWIYAGFCLVSCIFVYYLLPETKGKSLEEIQLFFQSKRTES